MTAHPAPAPPRTQARADPTPLLSASGIALRRGGEAILDGVDLAVGAGETVTVVGPNGAGKTTLLRVMLGQLKPHAGSVWRREGLRIGYQPQSFPLDAGLPMRVSRFLGLGVRAPRAERLRRLAEVGAEALADRSLHDLSGGELRRVLLARALLRNPDLLVLDEPVHGVDLAGQAELYRLIARVAGERDCGVLMVSHELHFVMGTTDRVVCLNRHVCCAGAPESVRDHPEYKALLGAAPEAIAVYTHHHDHTHGVSGEVVPLDRERDG